MPQAVNCKKCGALFLKTGKSDLCNKCLDAQNQKVSEMNSFVITSTEEFIPLETLLVKFDMSRNEFEELYSLGKFVRVAKKVTMLCSGCKKNVPIENKTGGLCAACTRKLQSEI